MKAAGEPWEMIGYEVKMFYATYEKFFSRRAFDALPYVLKNALEESAVLHTRILCDVFLDHLQKPDDIILKHFLSGWPTDPKYSQMKALQDKLRTQYGTGTDPTSPCWEFNKRLAHATEHRDSEYDYRSTLNTLYPLIHDMICELEALTARNFPRRFYGPENKYTLFWS